MDDLDRKIKKILRKSKKQDSDVTSQKCPDSHLLASYADGVINQIDKGKVEEHLFQCSTCLDLVHGYQKVRMGEKHGTLPEVPGRLVDNAMNLVAAEETREGVFDVVLKFARETIEIISNPGNLAISHAAVPVPVRGEKGTVSANIITVNKIFSNVESAVYVERAGKDRVNIKAIVTDIGSGQPVDGLRISLFNPEFEMASHMAKKGKALFENVMFGKYVIKLYLKGKEIGHIALHIKK
jgi:hypothetical protein